MIVHPTTIVKHLGPSRVFALVLAMTIAVFADDHAHRTNIAQSYDSIVPLGGLKIELKPSNRDMFILASAESPYFDGCYSRTDATGLFTASGKKVAFYPTHIDFRLTATAMRPKMLDIDTYGALHVPETEINDYLLHLRFDVLVFHGLQKTTIQPSSVQLIGMPADVPYDERVFRISFDSPQQISIYDRMLLEVLSPSGDRLCKFHLDLF
jgi:hypothetical protein